MDFLDGLIAGFALRVARVGLAVVTVVAHMQFLALAFLLATVGTVGLSVVVVAAYAAMFGSR
jgi:Na+/H+ antiporter NhaB